MKKIKQSIKKPEVMVLSLLFAFRVVYFFCLGYNFTPDSREYIARDGFAWLHGSVDRYRLPVYPMLIDICQGISEGHFALLLCTIQLLLSLLSIVVLFLTLKKLTDKKWVSLLVTALYATAGAISAWDKTLLTESISLSLTVFIIFGIVSYIKDTKLKYIILTTGCILIGCFLRAVFVIYAGLFFGFLILTIIFPIKNEAKAVTAKLRVLSLKGALVSAVPIILVFVYAFTFNNLYGAFTISDSGLGQQLYVVLENGYYKEASDTEIKEIADSILGLPAKTSAGTAVEKFVNDIYGRSDINEKELKQIRDQISLALEDNILSEAVENRLNEYIFEEYESDYNCSFTKAEYLARLYIMESFDRDRVAQFVAESKSNHLKEHILRTPTNLFEAYSGYISESGSQLFIWITRAVDNVAFFLNITILHTLIVALIEIIAFFILLIKKKKVEWIRLGLGVFIFATVALSALSTNAEFARTSITALPFMFVAVSGYMDFFYSYLTNKDKAK